MDDDIVQTRESLELRDYLRVLRDRFWVIPLTVLVFLAVTLLISLLSTPQYKASARLLYQKNNLEQALFGSQVFTNTQQDRDVQTGAVLVKLEPVAEAVKEDLGSTRSTESLLGMVSVESKNTTNVVDVSAVSTSPEEAAAVANSFADQFVLFRQAADRQTVEAARELVDAELESLSRTELESDYGQNLKQKYDNLRIIEAMQNGGFTVVQEATVPSGSFSPRPLRDSVVAIVLGLIAGVGLAFLLDYMDRGVKDEKALENALGAPVLARVPLFTSRKGDKRLSWSMDAVGFIRHPILLEAFRALRSNLEFFAVGKQTSTWLITSSEPQEGKSTTIVNLALSLALSGKRVVVIDADLRRPVIHEYLGVEQAPGLSNLLADMHTLEKTLRLVKADEFIPTSSRRPGSGGEGRRMLHRNMYVLSAGPVPPNPTELLGSTRMADVVDSLASMCDYVLIDAPPVLTVSDTVTLARLADGVVVVARMRRVTRDQVFEVRELLARANVKVLGAVAVGSKLATSKRYGYGYGYGSDSQKADPKGGTS